jgi:hypothetical protein
MTGLLDILNKDTNALTYRPLMMIQLNCRWNMLSLFSVEKFILFAYFIKRPPHPRSSCEQDKDTNMIYYPIKYKISVIFVTVLDLIFYDKIRRSQTRDEQRRSRRTGDSPSVAITRSHHSRHQA